MELYQRMGDRSRVKLYWIPRYCGDFTTANDMLQALKKHTELDAECPKRPKSRSLNGQLHCQLSASCSCRQPMHIPLCVLSMRADRS